MEKGNHSTIFARKSCKFTYNKEKEVVQIPDKPEGMWLLNKGKKSPLNYMASIKKLIIAQFDPSVFYNFPWSFNNLFFKFHSWDMILMQFHYCVK